MTKRIIWVLGALIGFSIMGLILNQSIWVRNALKVSQKQFDQRVSQGLAYAANEVGRYLSFSAMFNRDNISYNYDTTFTQSSYDPHTQTYQSFSIDISVNNNNNLSINKSVDDENSKQGQNMEDFFRNTNIEDLVKFDELKELLRNEMLTMGIDLNFEFGVKKPDGAFVLQSNNFKPENNSSIYKARIPTRVFFEKPDFIWLYFPQENKFIFRSLGFITISSLVLIFILTISSTLVTWLILKQKKLSEMKSDFISNMTHELKTPISTISLASQMLNDKSIPVETMNIEYITGLIDEESKRLGFQVERVLQTAILDGGKIKLKLKRIDANVLISNVINNFEIQTSQRNGRLIKELDANNTEIMADEVHFSNVLLNLLDNALKYTNGSPEITISTKNKNNKLIIVVKDNGIGISKKDQKHIFDKFFRVSTGNVHNVKGFGLGLHYVKSIVEEHKGTISLESEINKGTEFKIELQYLTDN